VEEGERKKEIVKKRSSGEKTLIEEILYAAMRTDDDKLRGSVDESSPRPRGFQVF